eukprot:CAMPEP_0198315886 /NCGR_PEP_ID=MMETSP1450-20131203/5979_1 /TAXON_ID=753684 ORGANISM="Madagascaria erythrocladiodes, Strain CCMP3234" /NCGR_SAMPLE_ID=MMETSP1450 /ASSEMBLY_ACC=CAM_ASM_001115 /LENGTH=561 /DNA_ID=CAMNT_0044019013 /DNA_START=60 /DNA_END=1745 /DNA_ORIENTATION=-
MGGGSDDSESFRRKGTSSLEAKMTALNSVFADKPPTDKPPPVALTARPATSPAAGADPTQAPSSASTAADWWSQPAARAKDKRPPRPAEPEEREQARSLRTSTGALGLSDWWSDPKAWLDGDGAAPGSARHSGSVSATTGISTALPSGPRPSTLAFLSPRSEPEPPSATTWSGPPSLPSSGYPAHRHPLLDVPVSEELKEQVTKATERRYVFDESWKAICLIAQKCHEDTWGVEDLILCFQILPFSTEGSVAVKILCTLHRVLLEGSFLCLNDAVALLVAKESDAKPKVNRKNDTNDSLSDSSDDEIAAPRPASELLDTIIDSWEANKSSRVAQHAWKTIIIQYAKMLKRKLDFHRKYPEFEANYSLDRFFRKMEIETPDPTQKKTNHARHRKLLEMGCLDELFSLLESTASVLEANRTLTQRMEVPDSCLVPLVTDVSFNFEIIRYIASKILTGNRGNAKVDPQSLEARFKETNTRLHQLLHWAKFDENFVRAVKVSLASGHPSTRILSFTPNVPSSVAVREKHAPRPESFARGRIPCCFNSFSAMHEAMERSFEVPPPT